MDFPVHPDFILTSERDIFRPAANEQRWEAYGDWNSRVARDHAALFASASSVYPGEVASHLGLACTPQCTICHQTNAGGDGTATKPFAVTMKTDYQLDGGSQYALLDAALDQMNTAGVDWQMLLHSGAGHSFTNKAMDGSRPGFVYHEASDRRSWQAMINLFDEVFGANQT